MGRGERKRDTDLALREMLEVLLAQHYLKRQWNLFLVTLIPAQLIVNGQNGMIGNHVTETMDGESRLERGALLCLENTEVQHVSGVILLNRGNVLLEHPGVKLENGQSGVHSIARELLDNILKLEKDLLSMKIPSSLDMIAREKKKMLKLDCVKDVLLGGIMSLMAMNIIATEF